MIRCRQVVGGGTKPGQDTWGTLRRAISADSIVFGRCVRTLSALFRPLLAMTLVLPLSAVLLGFSAGRSPAAEIADLPSANGGTQHIWYAAPADPWAVAIMFIGGDGVIPWEADGSLKGGRSTRQLWLDQGIAVLIAGKPTWLTVAYSYRLTDAYARDIP